MVGGGWTYELDVAGWDANDASSRSQADDGEEIMVNVAARCFKNELAIVLSAGVSLQVPYHTTCNISIDTIAQTLFKHFL